MAAAAAANPIVLAREAGNGGDCILMMPRIKVYSKSKKGYALIVL